MPTPQASILLFAAFSAIACVPNPLPQFEAGSTTSEQHGNLSSESGSDGSSQGNAGVSSDPPQSTSDSEGATGSSTAASATCADTGGSCVPRAPQGWSGPVVLLDRGAHPDSSCASPFPALSFTAYDDLTAASAQCGCQCDATANPRCTTRVYRWDPEQTTCGSLGLADGSWTITGSTCYPSVNGVPGSHWRAFGDFSSDGCDAIELSKTVPAASWGIEVSACTAPLMEQYCGPEEACLPTVEEPYVDTLCVWAEGDIGCATAGAYTDAATYYRDFDDTRDCHCECGPAGGSCSGSVGVWNEPECEGFGAAQFDVGGPCYEQGGTGGISMRASTTVQPGTCPAVSQVEGDAQPQQPLTVCCLPTR